MKGGPEYNFYRGVQRPIEFKGFKGKFIYIAAGSVFGGLLAGIVMLALDQTVPGLMCIFVGVSGVFVAFIRQKQGLYNKNKDKGLFIVKKLFR